VLRGRNLHFNPHIFGCLKRVLRPNGDNGQHTALVRQGSGSIPGLDLSIREVLMQNIVVGRYEEASDYEGWIEPEDRKWIMYVRSDHSVEVFLHRDEDTGAILE
jgi:hypothetical protein